MINVTPGLGGVQYFLPVGSAEIWAFFQKCDECACARKIDIYLPPSLTSGTHIFLLSRAQAHLSHPPTKWQKTDLPRWRALQKVGFSASHLSHPNVESLPQGRADPLRYSPDMRLNYNR